MLTTNIVVQARMGSSRLPGKMMLDLYGEPLLFRILQRLTFCKSVHKIILAIPEGELNNILAEVAYRINGIEVVSGSENNLIKRFQTAIKKHPSDFVIRFPGDNVFPDPVQIDNLVNFHKNNNPKGFSSNLASVYENRMIDGVGAEIFPTCLLMGLSPNKTDMAKQEHLHLNFYDYVEGIATTSSVRVSAPIPDIQLARPEFALDINTIEQYSRIRNIYKNVCLGNSKFTTASIIEYLDQRAK